MRIGLLGNLDYSLTETSCHDSEFIERAPGNMADLQLLN